MISSNDIFLQLKEEVTCKLTENFDFKINIIKIQQISHPSPAFWRGAGVR